MKLEGKIIWKVTDERLEALYKVEDLLKDMGITFDTGYNLIKEQREWFIDQKVNDILLSLDIQWQNIIFNAEKVPQILSRVLELSDDPLIELKIFQALRESSGKEVSCQD